MADKPEQLLDENLDRVQELTWALLDELISEDEFEQLNRALLRDDKSRDSYIGCIQLHAELMAHFSETTPPDTKRANGPAVLGLLNADMPPVGFQSPSADEVTS